jgi:predicted transcriptional regulator
VELTTGKDTPSERERDAMGILWERGSATVYEVQAELNALYEPEVAYTTVLSMLRSLRAKGWVRVAKAGRAYVHYGAEGRDHARFWEVHRVIDLLYGSSVEDLLADVLADKRVHRLTPERVRRVVEERLKQLGPGRPRWATCGAEAPSQPRAARR